MLGCLKDGLVRCDKRMWLLRRKVLLDGEESCLSGSTMPYLYHFAGERSLGDGEPPLAGRMCVVCVAGHMPISMGH